MSLPLHPGCGLRTHLALVHPRRGGRIVRAVAPGRVMGMEDEATVVRDDGLVECYRPDPAPGGEGSAPLAGRAVGLALVGDLDVEPERAFRRGVAAIVDLRHDLVAEVQGFARNARLLGRYEEAHELRRARRLARRLAQLGD